MNKKLLAVAVSSALAAPMAAHAVKYKLSGQVNRAVVYQSDGQNSDIQFVDNNTSGSRWRMKGSEDIGNGMKVGFNWEWQAQSNKAGGAIGSQPSGLSQDLRKSEVWFSGGWGKVSLGKGDGAGNGTTEVDLSNTDNVTYYGRTSFGGAVEWRTGAGNTITSGGKVLTHGDTFSEFDAFSRYDRVRYDTPSLGPVTLSVSAGGVDLYEGAARWSQGLGGGQISAGLFYGKHSGGIGAKGVENRYGGSVSYLFSFGTNITLAGAENEPDVTGSTKANTWYLKVGHKWGNNAVSVSYGESKDVIVGFNDKGFQIGFNHNIPKAKADLYAGIQSNTLDTPSGVTAVDDIYTVAVGTKLKFD
jgi:predicted porin